VATIAQIREGLAANLSTISGIQISAYLLASPTPPAIHVVPSSIAYDRTFARGIDRVEMTVQAFVGMGLDQGAQIALDELLAPTGARSVKTAIEADKTLGGVVQDVWVSAMSGYNVVIVQGGQQQMLSADWAIQVTS
jgi:hypothetical protein